MGFLVLAHDGAVGYQCSNSRLLHSSHDVLIPLLGRLCTRAHDYGSGHLINLSVFTNTSAYVACQRFAEVETVRHATLMTIWYYCTFESGFVHDVPSDVVEKRQRDASVSLITRRTLPSHEISLVVPAEH